MNWQNHWRLHECYEYVSKLSNKLEYWSKSDRNSWYFTRKKCSFIFWFCLTVFFFFTKLSFSGVISISLPKYCTALMKREYLKKTNCTDFTYCYRYKIKHTSLRSLRESYYPDESRCHNHTLLHPHLTQALMLFSSCLHY